MRFGYKTIRGVVFARGAEHPAANETSTANDRRWYPVESVDGLVREPTGSGYTLTEARGYARRVEEEQKADRERWK